MPAIMQAALALWTWPASADDDDDAHRIQNVAVGRSNILFRMAVGAPLLLFRSSFSSSVFCFFIFFLAWGEGAAEPCAPLFGTRACNASGDGGGSGFQACLPSAAGWGPCHVTACAAGLTLSSGRCFALSITASPPSVAVGGSSILAWDATPAGPSACAVTANNYTLWTGVSGRVNTSTYGGLVSDTAYLLSCLTPSGAVVTGQVIVRVPVHLPAEAASFAVMRGANIFDGDFWFSNAPRLAATARAMNINVVRINMNLFVAVQNGSRALELMADLSDTLDALDAHQIRAILVFGGFIELEAPCGPLAEH
jgi:hypothetical protein